MKFFHAAALLFAGAVISSPASPKREAAAAFNACPDVADTPECCATDVLGLADLDCAEPPSTPTSLDDFTSICAAIGQRARCCTVATAEQGILCNSPNS